MSLPAREQQVLDGIETVLQAGETSLTSMFVLFTRLAEDEEKPRAEELGPQSRRPLLPLRVTDGYRSGARRRSPAAGRWAVGGSGEWLRVVILLTIVVAALGSALVLSLSTTSVRTCGPTIAAHDPGAALSQPESCQSSRSVPTPTRGP
jgi:hypothetical protein